MRLMIVDDQPGAREMIRKFLASPGITFCECASGKEALERVRDFKPHWVTVDIHMPEMDGFQTTQALLKEHPSARVVIVSSYNEPQFRQHARAAGAVCLILKENVLALHRMLAREIEGGNSSTSASNQLPETP